MRPDDDNDRLVTLDEAIQITQTPRSTVYSKLANNTFPARVKLMEGRHPGVAFRLGDLKAYNKARHGREVLK